MPVDYLSGIAADAHARTLGLIADFDDDNLIGPRQRILSPPLWVAGHIAWLYDRYLLTRMEARPAGLPDMDALFDDRAVPHPDLWSLDFPERDAVIAYSEHVAEAVSSALGNGAEASPEATFFCRFCVQREDMLGEMLIAQRQTLGLPAPSCAGGEIPAAAPCDAGDIIIPGGVHALGAVPEDPFYLDNEKWGHGYEVEPFAISRLAVTNAEFRAFVEDRGYQREELWSPAGWGWRAHAAAGHPVYWRQGANGWEQRRFDKWLPLAADEPVIHVNWFEADAWCRWSGRRLPWEGEWEIAASLATRLPDKIRGPKSRYPWGDDPGDPPPANLDARAIGPCAVTAFPDGDSGYGLRQMAGNVWEWTQSVLSDYPGFTPDAMEHLSRPFMDGAHPVFRGGSWATHSRAVWNNFRNFDGMDRRDRFTGFRSCAV